MYRFIKNTSILFLTVTIIQILSFIYKYIEYFFVTQCILLYIFTFYTLVYFVHYIDIINGILNLRLSLGMFIEYKI